MSASRSGSRASSQGTVPTTETSFLSESTDFSDPLLEKVFLAGCRKNFVGRGPRQFSIAEIKELNVLDVVDLVDGKVEHSHQVKKSITYHLGLCRIYQKAVAFFEEDVMKFHDELNSLLYHDKSVPSTPKKTQKPVKNMNDQEDNEIADVSIHSLQLIDHNYVSLMERKLKTDKHLLNEMDDRLHAPALDTLGDFGDESHLHHGLPKERNNPFGSPPLIPSDLINNIEAQNIFAGFGTSGGTTEILSGTVLVTQAEVHRSEDTEAGLPSLSRREDERNIAAASTKATPKRKPGSPHDETPSKRQRIKSPTDPSGKSSVSRKLFGPGAPSSPRHASEIVRQNLDPEGVEPFDERMPPITASQEGTQRISVQIGVDSTPVQDTEVNQEPERLPAAVIPPEDVQHLPGTSPVDSVGTELEELPEETIVALTPKRRKRMRPLVDKEKQIPRMDITNFEKYVHVHTKTLQSTHINLDKLLLKNLFSMPSTMLKARGLCIWPKKLQYLYMENARPILHPNHEKTLPSLTPRDINVEKGPRLSTFRPNDRPGLTGPPIFEDQNITPAGIVENNEDPDRELMPPPPGPPMLPLPSDEQGTPRTPGRSQNKPPSVTSSPQQKSPRPSERDRQLGASSSQQRLQRTPGRDKQPDISAVSPSQGQIPFILEPEPAAEAEQSAQAQLPVPMSPTPSARERSTLMDDRMFYKFLEDKWVTNFGKVELDDLIDPRRSTLTKFHRYFTYLQNFQVKKKLSMEQETIYGPVNILKTIEE